MAKEKIIIEYDIDTRPCIYLNKISVNELIDKIKALKQPNCVGQKKEINLSGHSITVESDLKKNCFNLEWKIIEIK